MNFVCPKLRSFRGLTSPRRAYERRQDPVRSGHGVRTPGRALRHRPSTLRQFGRAHVVVRRAVPRNGHRATHLPRESARHRDQPVGKCRQAACDGLSRGDQALHVGRRQRIARLAHLVGPRRALLVRRARKLYASDPLGVELDNTIYALDSSTIDLCLSLFDWATFRSTKAAVKLHTLLDLRRAIPAPALQSSS